MSGAKTPMSKFITMCIVLLALSSLTTQFFYIPQAALSAVIFVSINSLVNLRYSTITPALTLTHTINPNLNPNLNPNPSTQSNYSYYSWFISFNTLKSFFTILFRLFSCCICFCFFYVHLVVHVVISGRSLNTTNRTVCSWWRPWSLLSSLKPLPDSQ